MLRKFLLDTRVRLFREREIAVGTHPGLGDHDSEPGRDEAQGERPQHGGLAEGRLRPQAKVRQLD